ncbi:MAG: glycosyltransferase [Bacteroidales bacterium]|nr:glycosyltransferase [Bacteroidales bacterium]
MDEVMVSVICLAYNHEAWIRDALEGFVKQLAPFRFEVLVHDDASTDGTASIIREYQARYPGLIRAVFQTENQLSKGIPVSLRYLAPLVRGRYVALCEGDDYWTDPHKLEKQVTALEERPQVDICAHCVCRMKDGKRRGYVAPRLRSGLLSPGSVIVGGGSRCVATSSLLCRADAYLRLTPMRGILVNDYVLQLQCAARGGMYYLSDCMSVYRTGVPGSWNARNSGRRAAARATNRKMLLAFDTYTQGRFSDDVALRLALYDSDDLLQQRRFGAMLAPSSLRVTFRQVARTVARLWRECFLTIQRL